MQGAVHVGVVQTYWTTPPVINLYHQGKPYIVGT